jgi:hypothetical protein
VGACFDVTILTWRKYATIYISLLLAKEFGGGEEMNAILLPSLLLQMTILEKLYALQN